jgi:hypothetical protein
MPEQAAREQAAGSLKKKRDFRGHLVVYLMVNSFLVAIWIVTGHKFFWPVFVIAGWGIGLVANAWDAYGRPAISEKAIQHEMERQSRNG